MLPRLLYRNSSTQSDLPQEVSLVNPEQNQSPTAAASELELRLQPQYDRRVSWRARGRKCPLTWPVKHHQ